MNRARDLNSVPLLGMLVSQQDRDGLAIFLKLIRSRVGLPAGFDVRTVGAGMVSTVHLLNFNGAMSCDVTDPIDSVIS